MSSTPGPFLRYFGFAVCFWGTLALLGWPACHSVDDTPYIVPAIEFARTGWIRNPYHRLFLESIGLRADRFHSYPPMYFVLLGSWFRVFGVGTASLLGFNAVGNVVFSRSSWVFLRRVGATTLGIHLWTLLYVQVVSQFGFRPDGTGYALMLAGLALIVVPGRVTMGFGTMLLVLSPLCQPSSICYAFLFGAAILVQRVAQVGIRPAWTRTFLPALVGIAAALLVFAAVLRWEVPEFVTEFRRAAHRITPPRYYSLREFIRLMTFGWSWLLRMPVLLFSLGVWGTFLMRPQTPGRLKGWLVVGFAAVLGNIVLMSSPDYRLEWILFVLFGGSAVLLASAPMRPMTRMRAWSVFLVLASLRSISSVVTLVAVHGPDPEHLQSIRRAVAPYEKEPYVLLFDSDVARYVYDFELPANANSLEFCPRPIRHAVILEREHKIRPQPAVFLGKEFRSIPKHPYRFVLIVDGKVVEIDRPAADRN